MRDIGLPAADQRRSTTSAAWSATAPAAPITDAIASGVTVPERRRRRRRRPGRTTTPGPSHARTSSSTVNDTATTATAPAALSATTPPARAISGSAASGAVTRGRRRYTGGLVGYNDGAISNAAPPGSSAPRPASMSAAWSATTPPPVRSQRLRQRRRASAPPAAARRRPGRLQRRDHQRHLRRSGRDHRRRPMSAAWSATTRRGVDQLELRRGQRDRGRRRLDRPAVGRDAHRRLLGRGNQRQDGRDRRGASTGLTGIGGTTGLDPHAQATYAGFNFTTIWTIKPGTSRPYLQNPAPARRPTDLRRLLRERERDCTRASRPLEDRHQHARLAPGRFAPRARGPAFGALVIATSPILVRLAACGLAAAGSRLGFDMPAVVHGYRAEAW